jgi:hypothetical protein
VVAYVASLFSCTLEILSVSLFLNYILVLFLVLETGFFLCSLFLASPPTTRSGASNNTLTARKASRALSLGLRKRERDGSAQRHSPVYYRY